MTPEGVLFILIYLCPTCIAARRNHNNRAAIGIINIFLGWTLIGWVVSLAWAFSDNVTPKVKP